jgi:hypothetical protein
MASDPYDEDEPQERTEIPAAFYRDAVPPPRSSKDPRWAEFKRSSDELPDWMILAAPAVLAGILALHGVVAIILALLMHQRLFGLHRDAPVPGPLAGGADYRPDQAPSLDESNPRAVGDRDG